VQDGRLFRDGVASSCGAFRFAPTLDSATGPFNYRLPPRRALSGGGTFTDAAGNAARRSLKRSLKRRR
jgi:hypothetical protein